VQFIAIQALVHFVTLHVFKTVKPLLRNPINNTSRAELDEIELLFSRQPVNDFTVTWQTQVGSKFLWYSTELTRSLLSGT
jgi:hypothetical protein